MPFRLNEGTTSESRWGLSVSFAICVEVYTPVVRDIGTFVTHPRFSQQCRLCSPGYIRWLDMLAKGDP